MAPHLNAPTALEPLLPSTPRADKLLEKAHDLRMEAARLSGAFPGGVNRELVGLLQSMNAYYSNKIEGEHASPLQIAQALLGRFSQEAETARLQHLAVAHMQTERWIQESSLLPADLYAAHTIRSIHSHLFSPWDHEDGGRLPPGAQVGTNKATYSPGVLRTCDVVIGRHVAPGWQSLEALLQQWSKGYGAARPGEMQIVAAAAAHHRLLWMHPFVDGNGRVARLQTLAVM